MLVKCAISLFLLVVPSAFAQYDTSAFPVTLLATICSTYSGSVPVKHIPRNSTTLTFSLQDSTFSAPFSSPYYASQYSSTSTRSAITTATLTTTLTSTSKLPTTTSYTCVSPSDTTGVPSASSAAAQVHKQQPKPEGHLTPNEFKAMVQKAEAKAAVTPAVAKGSYPTSVACSKLVGTYTVFEIYTTTQFYVTGTRTSGVTTTTLITSTKTAKLPATSTTITTTALATTTTLGGANPQGFLWAYYNNNQGPNSDSTYSQFDPTAFWNMTPEYVGISTSGFTGYKDIKDPYYSEDYEYGNGETYQGYSLGYPDIPIYGSPINFHWDNFVLNHKFYIQAPVTASYYIMFVDSVDDLVLAWVGDNVATNWTRENAVIDYASGACANYLDCVYTFDMNAGDYMPVRIMFAQASGPLSFVGILGYTANNQNYQTSLYDYVSDLVQYSCDGVAAPVFPPFGHEGPASG